MKDKNAYKTALLMADAGYWSIGMLLLRKAYGK